MLKQKQKKKGVVAWGIESAVYLSTQSRLAKINK